jgi:type I restriction enzyme S subunit
MEAASEIKNGYKHTKLGWIPDDWKVGRVNDLLHGLESGVSVNGEDRKLNSGEKGVLKVSAVSYGHFNEDAVKVIESNTELKRAKTHPKRGQIIISRSNTEKLVGASAYIEFDNENLFLPDKLWQTIPKSNANMKWLSYVLASEHSRYTLSNLATGTSGTMKNITKGELLNLKISIAPLPEQQKIAQILSTWDKAIEQSQNLIEQLKSRKKGLMQQLLTGKTRLKGYNNVWNNITLSDVLFEPKKNAVNNASKIELLTVKLHCKGIEATGKYPNVTVNGRPYYSRHEGELLIGRQNFHNGGFGVVTKELNGLIASNAITSLLPQDNCNLRYLVQCFSLPDFYKRVGHIIGGTGQKEISTKEFFKLKFILPSIKEQQAIAKVLTTADDEIKVQETYLARLQAQKKGLMQVLLTGQKRVKIE